jgi:hypothetical protein
MCENTDITFSYVVFVDVNIVVPIWCIVLEVNSQSHQQRLHSCSVTYATVALEVQLLAL